MYNLCFFVEWVLLDNYAPKMFDSRKLYVISMKSFNFQIYISKQAVIKMIILFYHAPW